MTRRILLNRDGEFEWLPAEEHSASVIVRSRVIQLPRDPFRLIEAAVEEEVYFASAVRDEHGKVCGVLYTPGPSTQAERDRARKMFEQDGRA